MKVQKKKKQMTPNLHSMRVEVKDQHLPGVYLQKMDIVLVEGILLHEPYHSHVNFIKWVIAKKETRAYLVILGLRISGDYYFYLINLNLLIG
jgi:hypothetical protein